MTNEELTVLQARVDELSIELNAIIEKIHDRQTEIDALWERYWRVFRKLTDEIKVGNET